MGITPETKIHDLLERHSFLLEFLVAYNGAYAKLRNPVLYNTVGRFATLKAAAEMASIPVETLIEAIEREVALKRIHAESASPDAGASGPTLASVGGLNADRELRQAKLKQIIRSLHDGATVDQVKAEFDALVQQVDASEIAAMEQALIAEGMPVSEVQRLCDVHVSVFKESLESSQDEGALAVEPGHPVDSYRRENVLIGEITTALRCSIEESAALESSQAGPVISAILESLDRLLGGLTVHYVRKENQLFPVLEQHGIEGPTKVMWGLDDEIRERIKGVLTALRAGGAEALDDLPELLGMVEDMVYKEEKILFPAALGAISAEEWAAMAAGDAEIGFAWIDGPPALADGPASSAPATPGTSGLPADLLPLTTGVLTLEQLDLILRTLPVDITFVDETGRVRYYSEGERVFPRSPAVIGREVRNCHPPKSVAVVERIVEEFRTGSRDVAEFWIEMGERFVHIRYFALRDASGTYRGVLEVSQDVTRIRALEGQQRLLDGDPGHA